MRTFFRNHGLSITMMGLFLVLLLGGQVLTGQRDYNNERERDGEAPVSVVEYLGTGHFAEATAENWESEFLQMFVFAVATSFLYQKGSAESKDPRKKHEHKAKRPAPATAPWPVRHGGWICRLYEHSLSLALFLLFAIAFIWHLWGGLRHYNEELAHEGEPLVEMSDYVTSSRFWFESFQNWQSEFLAIGVMVLLTIWLREVNSPESKKVETPHWENEE